ncbi:hypothetical protein GCM10025883_28880 [Mobilicoccus caccae]|uniref:FtsK domain-containing protein n=1 Tax=Mobilicoccus caccae TaxID=1859295 RepID=A0ABQ6IU72_9MICO|nr:hypothetical protein GCM10025883_28880 [Mobilicoccus caccae]
MFAASHVTAPVAVRVEHSSAGAGARALVSVVRAVGALLGVAMHAPLLVVAAALIGGWAGLLTAGHYVVASTLVLLVAAAGAVLARYRPGTLRGLTTAATGQAFRVLVYRPRWDTACHAAHLAPRIGTATHTPGLVRHTRTANGIDVLLVRMAPGQTLSTWRDASASLAATFTAHAVTVRETGRPGWVLLDVLRRDPLAQEIVAPDPDARRGTITSLDHASAVPAPGRRGGMTVRTSPGMPRPVGAVVRRAPAADPYTSDPWAVVLGRDEHGRSVALNPYGTAHAGMQGATRSGKSSACYTLLAALAHRPDVIVTGVDPSGLLLGPFTSENGGRGGALIATGTSRDDITHAVAVMSDLVTLMDTRIRVLRSSGVDKITTFTASAPAVWVVMEEYPGLLAAAKALDNETGAKAGERLAPRLAAALGRLVKEGAKVGLFVLVLAQRMSADALATDDRMNLALRLTLRVDNGDAVAMLHDGITRDHVHAVRDFAPGMALVESPGVKSRVVV